MLRAAYTVFFFFRFDFFLLFELTNLRQVDDKSHGNNTISSIQSSSSKFIIFLSTSEQFDFSYSFFCVSGIKIIIYFLFEYERWKYVFPFRTLLSQWWCVVSVLSNILVSIFMRSDECARTSAIRRQTHTHTYRISRHEPSIGLYTHCRVWNIW